MKTNNIKTTHLVAAIVLTLCSFGVLAEVQSEVKSEVKPEVKPEVHSEESHNKLALEHAQEAVKAADVKAVVEHAEIAKTHAKVADEHLDAGIKSLEEAIEHGKLGHDKPAKKAAEEAVNHFKAAQ
ncbi:MAG: small metal-binding protein SmbP [Methylobacter sp.]